jgi:hypothetical protein
MSGEARNRDPSVQDCIVIVNPNPRVRENFESILSKMVTGSEIFMAEDGEVAIAKIRELAGDTRKRVRENYVKSGSRD